MIMKTYWLVLLGVIAVATPGSPQTSSSAPLRVGIVGLVHGHAGGFLGGGALVPAGAALHRSDIQVVGVAEPQRELFDRYAKRLGMSSLLFFAPKMAKKKKSLLSRHLSKLGKKGGKARLETMTEDQRKESSRKAAQARWAKAKLQ